MFLPKTTDFMNNGISRAIAMLEPLKQPMKSMPLLCQLSRHHRPTRMIDVAWRIGPRAKELEDDLQLVRSVPVAETGLPALVLSEALTLAALGQWSGEIKPFSIPDPLAAAKSSINFETGPRRTDGRADRLAAVDCQAALAHTGGSSNRSLGGSRHLVDQIRRREARS